MNGCRHRGKEQNIPVTFSSEWIRIYITSMLNWPKWWDVITRQFNFAFSLFFNYSVGLVLPQHYKVWHLYILIVILKRCKALRLFQDTNYNLKLLLKMANPIYKQIFQIHLKLQQLPHFKSRLLQVKKKWKTGFCSHSEFLLFQFPTLLRLGLGSYRREQLHAHQTHFFFLGIPLPFI